MRTLALSLVAAVTFATAPVSAQDAVEKFYKGNTITINVPSSAGGTYGLAAQLVSQHMPKHIPGKPSMVLQIMPGGVKATNYMANVAAQDGSVINLLSQSMPDLQASKAKGVQFDVLKFHPIGLIAGLNGAFVVDDRAPAKTIDEMKSKVILAGTRERSDYGFQTVAMLNHFHGTKIKVILGYDGGAETDLAMERGELHGKLSSWLSIKERHPQWGRGEGAKVVLQIGTERDPDIPNVPTLVDLAKTDEQKKIFMFLAGNNSIARGLTAPPGVPADRVAALRNAFDAMIKEGAFTADLAKHGFPMNHKDWKGYAAMIKELAETPPEIIALSESVLSKAR
jgi:tripartite-type tricarboxylate transporter receptor subunit TctC